MIPGCEQAQKKNAKQGRTMSNETLGSSRLCFRVQVIAESMSWPNPEPLLKQTALCL